MPRETLTSRNLARRLIDREPGRHDDMDAAAAYAACEQVNRDLCRWVGSAGSEGLFNRALLNAQRAHPGLAGIEIRPDTEARIAEVGDGVRPGGSSVTAAALEALLVELIELLSRFIGADLVVRLLDHSVSGQRRDQLTRDEQEASP